MVAFLGSSRCTHSRSLRPGPVFVFGPVLCSSRCRASWYLGRSLLAMLDFAATGRLDTSITTCSDIAGSMVLSTTATRMFYRSTAASKEHVVVSVGEMRVTVGNGVLIVAVDGAPPL